VVELGREQIHNRESLKQVRRSLRDSLTPAEAVLWKNLQRSQLNGRKFRRQHSVGNYILDFYCPESRLAIELDGQGHFNSITSEHDGARTNFLRRLNIRVLRFENRAVFENLGAVLEVIRNATTPLPPPAPGGE
jgi:very-short-patch-repair endonuclease